MLRVGLPSLEMRKSLLVLASVASAFLVLVACGGTSSVSIPGASDTDGATTPPDGAAPTDASTIQDAKVTPDATEPGKDAGLVVKELPAPDCHDLQQVGKLVTPTPSAGDPPTPMPLASIVPGLYVVVEINEYGQTATPMTPTRTTADFTSTREYYIAESANGDSTAYSLDYQVANGMLTRTITCPPNSQMVPDYQIGASTNGFTVYVPTGIAGGIETVRYEHAN